MPQSCRLQRLSPHRLIYLILSKNYSITRARFGDIRLGQQLGCGPSGGRSLLSASFCCAARPDKVTIVAGEASERLHFLRLENIE